MIHYSIYSSLDRTRTATGPSAAVLAARCDPAPAASLAAVSATALAARSAATRAASAAAALNCGSPSVVMSIRPGPSTVKQKASPEHSCSAAITAAPPRIRCFPGSPDARASQLPCCVTSSIGPFVSSACHENSAGRLSLLSFASVGDIACGAHRRDEPRRLDKTDISG